MLRTARKLITGARGIDAGDLNLPERSTNFSVDVVELEKRAAGAEQSLRRTPNDFQAQLAAPDTANLEALRDLILRSAGFGVAGAVPLSAAGDSPADRQTLLAQAGSIQKELAQRVEQLTALAAGFNAGTATLEAAGAITRWRGCASSSARRLSCCRVLRRRTPTSLRRRWPTARRCRTAIRSLQPPGSSGWRACAMASARLNAALNYSEALNTGEKLKLTIAQLPYDADDRWVGLPLKAGQSLPGGKLSLAVQSAAPVDVRQPLAGLLIDEWVEVVPSATETTGIALQYDQPNAAPPQTILIAVPPEVDVPWTVWSLQQVLLETLDLARIRAVDPDALDEVGHYLPALYFALQHGRPYRFDRFHDDQVEGIMPSITSWMRLEPRSRNAEMNTSLQARIYDPLWLLARQWQLGEFQGEDNGSPVMARWRGGSGAADPLSFGRHCAEHQSRRARVMTAPHAARNVGRAGNDSSGSRSSGEAGKAQAGRRGRPAVPAHAANSSRCRAITATRSSANIRFRH